MTDDDRQRSDLRRRLAIAGLLLVFGVGLAAVVDGPQLLLAMATGSLEERGIDLRAYAGEPPCEGRSPCRSGTLRVMTLNVLCRDCGDDDHDPWETRAPRLRAQIERHDPDLLGLQELVGRADLDDVLGEDSPYEVVVHEFGRWIYADAALMYRRERFEQVAAGQLWLGRSPRIPFGRAWTPVSVPRYANWALLRERDTGFALLFVTTHFDNNAQNKNGAARLLGDTLRPLGLHVPLVVAGDFNTDRGSSRYAILEGTAGGGSVLRNANDLALVRELAGELPALPAAGSRSYLDPDKLVDHVFVGGPGRATVGRWLLDTPVHGPDDRRPSDHPAIVTDIQFER